MNSPNIYNNNNSSLTNNTSNNILSENNSNILFIGIIFVLTILLIISIFILFYLFKKRKKGNPTSSKNMVLNKIILQNPNNSISLNIVNPKDFQKLQNTSNVSEAGIIQQNNNVLNEIKTQNLKDEIHKIINTTSSSDSSRGKRGKRRKTNPTNNNENKNENIIVNNKEGSFDSKNIIKDAKKENISDINTQKLEQEIKEQIKKYVVEEHNI